jgi:hypothetical protein
MSMVQGLLLEQSDAPFSFPALVVGVDASKGKSLPFCEAGCAIHAKAWKTPFSAR